MEAVPDPELPMITLGDLGVVSAVTTADDGTLTVELTPTFLGCPALPAITAAVQDVLEECGHPDGRVRQVPHAYLEHGPHHPGGPRQARRPRHRPALPRRRRVRAGARRPRRPVPALRVAGHPAAQLLRADALPVDAALHGLPGDLPSMTAI